LPTVFGGRIAIVPVLAAPTVAAALTCRAFEGGVTLHSGLECW
jgi:hypothetical protein